MTREECEKQVLQHLKEIRKITRKYTHRNCYVSMCLHEDGKIHAYNDDTYRGDRKYPFDICYDGGETNETD